MLSAVKRCSYVTTEVVVQMRSKKRCSKPQRWFVINFAKFQDEFFLELLRDTDSDISATFSTINRILNT